MLEVLLDGILQSEDDITNISESFETTIIREDGFANTSPILREKSEAILSFSGAAFAYICAQRRANYCRDITIQINYICKDGTVYVLFLGTIQQKEIELTPHSCTGKINTIRDDSFSGKFRDYINVEIGLYNTQTIRCEELITINQFYTFSTDPTNVAGSQVSKQGFDVLDTLQYYLNYITDNSIVIVSDYLTTNLFFIAKGYHLHTTSGTIDQLYPSASFETLFDELRKKLNLYMAIEYDNTGTPYLRIEQQSYFYNDAVVLNIEGLPNGLRETLDTSILFNEVEVGSSNTQLSDNAYNYYPPNRLLAWQDEFYTGCASCAGDKDSKLELVSGFVISSNVIYETINTADGDVYNDDEIYLIAYHMDGSERVATITTDPVFGDNIYNYEINNESVLTNWSDVGARCIALTRHSGNAFVVSSPGGATEFIPITTDTVAFLNTYAQNNFEGVTVYDIQGNISVFDTMASNPYSVHLPATFGDVDMANVFTVPSNGTYKFRAAGTWVLCDPDNAYIDQTNSMEYRLTISVYADATLAVLVEEYSDIVSPVDRIPTGGGNADPVDTDMEIITPNLTLVTGNVVLVKRVVGFHGTGGVINDDAGICNINAIFELVYDDMNCQDTSEITQALPFVIEFKHDICLEDYLRIKANKSGKFIVNNYEYYLREIKYKPLKGSTLKLIGAESICPCSN